MSLADTLAHLVHERGPITVALCMAAARHRGVDAQRIEATPATDAARRESGLDTEPDTAALARRVLACWHALDRPDTLDVVDAAPRGPRVTALLQHLEAADAAALAAVRLWLVEPAREAQRALSAAAGRWAPQVATVATLPGQVRGLILAIDLLDRLPVHAVVMTPEGLREQYLDAGADGWIVRLGSPSTPALASTIAASSGTLPVGGHAYVPLAALAWLARATSALQSGHLLLSSATGTPDEPAVPTGAEPAAPSAATQAAARLSREILARLGTDDLVVPLDGVVLQRAIAELDCHITEIRSEPPRTIWLVGRTPGTAAVTGGPVHPRPAAL
ncbi:MAG: SAM-dependent methyltransferase [Vicinamibacterales bacterium]